MRGVAFDDWPEDKKREYRADKAKRLARSKLLDGLLNRAYDAAASRNHDQGELVRRSSLFRILAKNAPSCTLYRFDPRRLAYVFRLWPKFAIGEYAVTLAAGRFIASEEFR